MMRLPLSGMVAVPLVLALAGCGGMPDNRTVYSVKQPVVERSTLALDIATSPDGVPVAEQRRVAAWFGAMDLAYGDRVSVEDPLDNPDTRAAVALLAGRYGLMLSDAAPVSAGGLQPGQARIVIQRSRASVPGCPDWSATSDATLGNGTSPGYGCATNGNLAAMVADPEDLIKGRTLGTDTYITTATTPIKAYAEEVGKKVNQTQATGATGGPSGGN